MIVEVGSIIATNTDVMSSGRLNSIPFNGIITIDLQADLNAAANHFDLTIQLPGGDVPVDGQRVPGSNPALEGVLDERQLLRFQFKAPQGGHFVVSLTETGTAVCAFRFVLNS